MFKERNRGKKRSNKKKNTPDCPWNSISWVTCKIVNRKKNGLNYGDFEVIAHLLLPHFLCQRVDLLYVEEFRCYYCCCYFASFAFVTIIFSARNDQKTVLPESNSNSEVIWVNIERFDIYPYVNVFVPPRPKGIHTFVASACCIDSVSFSFSRSRTNSLPLCVPFFFCSSCFWYVGLFTQSQGFFVRFSFFFLFVCAFLFPTESHSIDIFYNFMWIRVHECVCVDVVAISSISLTFDWSMFCLYHADLLVINAAAHSTYLK